MKGYKERWQEFYEEAIEELPDGNFAERAKLADEKLVDEQSRFIDEAFDRQRDDEMLKNER